MMDAYSFLFARESTPPLDASPHNSDNSDIDEDTENFLYSQIYYDQEDEAPSNIEEVAIGAEIHASISTESHAVLTSTPAAKDKTVAFTNIKTTPITSEKGVLKLDIDSPIILSSTSPIEDKAKAVSEDKDKEVPKDKDTKVPKSSKKRKAEKKATTDKKRLAKLLTPIVIPDSDSNSDGKQQNSKTKSKSKISQAEDMEYSDSESKSRSITKSKLNGNIMVKGSKPILISDSSSDTSEESRSKTQKRQQTPDGKSRKKPEKLKKKKKKMIEEHVSVSSDSDSDDCFGEKVRVSDEDIVEIDSDLHEMIVDVSDVSDVLSDDGAPMDSLHVNMYTPETNRTVSFTSVNGSATNVDKSDKLDINVNIQDTIEGGDWTTDAALPRKSPKSSSRYFLNISGTGRRRPMCQQCKVIHLSESECKRRKKTCFICCEKDHLSTSCPRVLCNRCHDTDHRRNDCPCLYSVQNSYCKRCQMTGHQMEMCPDIWRQFHATTNGSEEPVRPEKPESNANAKPSCCNCGSSEHFVYECPTARPSKGFITYTQIAKYDRLSDLELRGNKTTRMPKQLNYIDAQKEQEKEENSTGSDPRHKALNASVAVRGNWAHRERDSQRRRKNNGGKDARVWPERRFESENFISINGPQQNGGNHTSTPKQRGNNNTLSGKTSGKKTVWSYSSNSTANSNSKNNPMKDRGFRSSFSTPVSASTSGNNTNAKQSQSESRVNQNGLGSKVGGSEPRKWNHGGKKRGLDSESPAATKRSRLDDSGSQKSLNASVKELMLSNGVKEFLKTAPQTTQQLNTLKNKLKREKKERNRERKEQFQECSFQNVENAVMPKKKGKKRKSRGSNAKNPWLPSNEPVFNIASAVSSNGAQPSTSKKGKQKKKNTPKQDHLYVRHPDALGESLNNSQKKKAPKNSPSNGARKKKNKKLPIYQQ